MPHVCTHKHISTCMLQHMYQVHTSNTSSSSYSLCMHLSLLKWPYGWTCRSEQLHAIHKCITQDCISHSPIQHCISYTFRLQVHHHDHFYEGHIIEHQRSFPSHPQSNHVVNLQDLVLVQPELPGLLHCSANKHHCQQYLLCQAPSIGIILYITHLVHSEKLAVCKTKHWHVR